MFFVCWLVSQSERMLQRARTIRPYAAEACSLGQSYAATIKQCIQRNGVDKTMDVVGHFSQGRAVVLFFPINQRYVITTQKQSTHALLCSLASPTLLQPPIQEILSRRA